MQRRVGVTAAQAVVDHGPKRALVHDSVGQPRGARQPQSHEAAHQWVRAGLAAAQRRARIRADHVAHVLLVSVRKQASRIGHVVTTDDLFTE